jgi:hypothetical protein
MAEGQRRCENREEHTVQLAQNSVHSAGAASARHADIELVCVVCHLSYLSVSLHSISLSSVLRCSGVSIRFIFLWLGIREYQVRVRS